MAKVVVFEDFTFDLIRRYSEITRDHEVHVRLADRITDSQAREAGFDPSNVIIVEKDSTNQNLYFDPERDLIGEVYFLDSLDGDFLEIIDKLPKDRAFLNSGSKFDREMAERLGYQVLKGSLSDAIRRVVGE